MAVEAQTATTDRVYDRTLTAGAKRLGAWGPGFLTKSEGLWATPHGVYVIGERVEGDEKVSYRIVDEPEALSTLRARGHEWRASQIEKANAPDADTAPETTGTQA